VKLTGGLASKVLGAVTGRCRRIGAVQDVRPRRGRRTGAGLVELRGLASSSSSRGFCCSSSPLSSFGVATAEGKRARGG
jgi:hypothetical protein